MVNSPVLLYLLSLFFIVVSSVAKMIKKKQEARKKKEGRTDYRVQYTINTTVKRVHGTFNMPTSYQ